MYGLTKEQAQQFAVAVKTRPPTFTPQMYHTANIRIAQITGRWIYQFDREKNIAAHGGPTGYPTNEQRFKVTAKLYPTQLRGVGDTTDEQSARKEIELYGWYPCGNTGSFVQVINNSGWHAISAIPEIAYFKRRGTDDEDGEDRTDESWFECLSYAPPAKTSDYDYLDKEKLFVRPGSSGTAIPKYTGWRTVEFQSTPSVTDGGGNIIGPILPGMPCYSDGNGVRWPLYSVFTGMATSAGVKIETDDLYYISLSGCTIGKKYLVACLPVYPYEGGGGLLQRYQWIKLSQVYEGS